MISERSEDQISQLIEGRKLRWSKNPHLYRSYHKSEHPDELPVVSLPNPVEILLNSPSLWLKAGDLEYTPSLLVKSFFIRKDGQEINDRVFSVFIADAKRSVAEKWGVVPLSAGNKQRNQYWDRDFVKALFTYTTLCEKSDWGLENKISYTVRDDIAFEEMENWYLKANIKTIKFINKTK